MLLRAVARLMDPTRNLHHRIHKLSVTLNVGIGSAKRGAGKQFYSATRLFVRGLLIFIFAVLPRVALAWEPFKTDVTQQAFPKGGAVLDHLVPAQMPSSSLATRVPYTYLARYSSRPSFVPGADVYVVRDRSSGAYRIHCQWSEISNTESQSRVVEIPQALAAVIYDVWANALLEVRYDRASDLIGFDGTTYFFSTWIRGLGTLDGKIWMPGDDLPPAWMVQAGAFLSKFAREDRRDLEACQKYFESLRTRLFRYYAASR